MVNTVYFWQGWERSSFALYSWYSEGNIGECCKGDAAFMGARLWGKKKKEGCGEEAYDEMSPQESVFLNYCSALFLSWHLPNWLGKLIDVIVASIKKKNQPALKWEESQHHSHKNSGYLLFSVSPHSPVGKLGEVWTPVTSISKPTVPALKITPPVAFRQIIFPLHLGFNIFSEALVIPT